MTQPDLFTYPSAPGFKRTDTSRDAAADMAKRAGRLRDRVLEVIRRGPKTADECASALRVSIMAIRPRCSELVVMEMIRDTTVRRQNSSGKKAIVWEAT